MHPKFSLCPQGDYDFFLGSETYQVGCFFSYDDDLLDGIAAALAANLTGLRSIDRIKKQISGHRSKMIDHDSPAKLTLLELEKHLVNSYLALKPRLAASMAEVVFDQAIVRVLTTIRNSLYLARRGYVFETAMVARGALEQIAWARGASRAASEDELFKIDIHKEITFMKSIYPNCGKLYGELSRYSHFDAKLHNLFYAANDGEIAVRMADRGTKFMAMHWPFKLSDVLVVVFEEFYRDRLSVLRGLTRQGVLRKIRFPMAHMKKYFSGVSDAELEQLFS